MKFNQDDRHTTVGQYINIWDSNGNYDVLIHLHELEEKLTDQKIEEVEDLILPMMENDDLTIPTEEREAEMEKLLNEKIFNEWGVLVDIMKRCYGKEIG